MGSACTVPQMAGKTYVIDSGAQMLETDGQSIRSATCSCKFPVVPKGRRMYIRDKFISKYKNQVMFRWRDSIVVKSTDNLVTIHFIGWNSKFDLELDLTSEDDIRRIAPTGLLLQDQIDSGEELNPKQYGIVKEYLRSGKDVYEPVDSEKLLKGRLKTPAVKEAQKVRRNSQLYRNKSWTFNSNLLVSPSDSEEESEIVQSFPEPEMTAASKKIPESKTPETPTNSRSDRIKKFRRRQSFPGAFAATGGTFEERMASIGLHIIEVEGDGNCLYRSVAHQFYLNEERHPEIRAAVGSHMRKHRDRYASFCTIDYDDYLERQSEDRTWGDDLEIKALEEIFDRRIVIYSSDSPFLEPIATDFVGNGPSDESQPIILSYHGQMHYNSVFNEKSALPLVKRGSSNILTEREITSVGKQSSTGKLKTR